MQIVTVCGGLFLLLALVMSVQTLVNWASGGAADGFTTVIILLLIYWQHHHDQPGHHRLLHCADLHRKQGPPALSCEPDDQGGEKR